MPLFRSGYHQHPAPPGSHKIPTICLPPPVTSSRHLCRLSSSAIRHLSPAVLPSPRPPPGRLSPARPASSSYLSSIRATRRLEIARRRRLFEDSSRPQSGIDCRHDPSRSYPMSRVMSRCGSPHKKGGLYTRIYNKRTPGGKGTGGVRKRTLICRGKLLLYSVESMD